MSLRNTNFVFGIAVYTGSETKIQKNSQKTRLKMSNIMLTTNKFILMIFLVQIFLASLAAFLGTKWMINNYQLAYLNF